LTAAFQGEAEATARSQAGLDQWLDARGDAVALVMVALGLAARILSARGSYLMADDVLHLDIARAPDLLAVYRASLNSPHPPLFMFLLHFWQRVVASPFGLRLLPVAFGTGFLWAAYRWAGSLLGKSSALATLALLAFLPSLVLLSAEVRGYSLLLWLIAAALVSLEKAFSGASEFRIGASAVLTGLALLTHYSAVWFWLAALAYGTVRLAKGGFPSRFARFWAVSQASLCALFAWLFVSHISKLRGSVHEQLAQADWLRQGYFQAGSGSPLRFLWRQTLSLFEFLFSSRAAGILALCLVLFGIAGLAVRRRPAAILLALPFLFSAAGGLLALYPYGGTRHCVDLMPFGCAAIASALGRLTDERSWVPLILGAAMVPAAFVVSGW
jgi:uncharacterized membrane protein